MHRAYHALPPTLRSPSGLPTNAVYGFTSMLLEILELEDPEYLGVALDSKGPTFRHASLESYKGTRKAMDDDFAVQIPWIHRVLDVLNLPTFEEPGIEADDFLGIVSELAVKERPDTQILVVTNDQDAFQLVNERVTVVCPQKGYKEVKRMDSAAVQAKLGVLPSQIPDYKGLAGDHSDNLTGVPGIGPKKAVDLLAQFGSLNGIYEHLAEIPEKTRVLLETHRESAFLCREVATILREGRVNFSFEACAVHDFKMEPALALFEELGFKSAMGRLKKLEKHWQGRRILEEQASLF